MKRIAVLAVLLQLLLLTACSDNVNETSESTLIFDKNGKITNIIVESFSRDYYTEEGLTAFINEKVDDFNDTLSDEEDITVSNISIKDGMARVTLDFANPDIYSSFYGFDTFYGTVNSAYDAGFFMDTTLKALGSSETVSKGDIMQMKDNMIIIVSEPIVVRSPKKIIYSSANVEVIDSKNVRISSDSTGLAYIITEK